MRVALYHRVSTTDQDPTLGRHDLRAAAARLGGDVVLDVEETGSGAANNRPGLLRVLEAARRGRIDTVIVWKLDRWGRSALDLLGNLRELEGCGVRFLATTQGLDVRPGGDAMSRLLLTVLAAVAEFERDLVRERTRAAIADRRRRGLKIGRPRVDVDVAAALAMRAEDMPWRRVAAELGVSTTTCKRAVEKFIRESEKRPAAPADACQKGGPSRDPKTRS